MGEFIDCSMCERKAKVFLITPEGKISRKKFCNQHWKIKSKDFHYQNHIPIFMPGGIRTGQLKDFIDKAELVEKSKKGITLKAPPLKENQGGIINRFVGWLLWWYRKLRG